MRLKLQVLTLTLLMPVLLIAQPTHWKTTGRNSMRHGVSGQTDPQIANQLWRIDAPYAHFPFHHFTFEGKLFTSR